MIYRLGVFLDTSALFSAVYSAAGASRELLRLGEVGEIRLLISAEVLREIDEKLRQKAPDKLTLLPILLARSGIIVTPDPPAEKIEHTQKLVSDPYDVEIVAAAWAALVDYFVAFDRIHLLNNQSLRAALPFPIGTAGECLAWYRNQLTAP